MNYKVTREENYNLAQKMLLEYLEGIMKEKGMTLESLSAIMGITSQNLWRIFQGKHSPSFTTILCLCDALGCYPLFVDKDSDEGPAKFIKERWKRTDEEN